MRRTQVLQVHSIGYENYERNSVMQLVFQSSRGENTCSFMELTYIEETHLSSRKFNDPPNVKIYGKIATKLSNKCAIALCVGFDAINMNTRHFRVRILRFPPVLFTQCHKCARTAFNPKIWSSIALHKNEEEGEHKRRNLHEYAVDHVFALSWPLEMGQNVRVYVFEWFYDPRKISGILFNGPHWQHKNMPSRTNFP